MRIKKEEEHVGKAKGTSKLGEAHNSEKRWPASGSLVLQEWREKCAVGEGPSHGKCPQGERQPLPDQSQWLRRQIPQSSPPTFQSAPASHQLTQPVARGQGHRGVVGVRVAICGPSRAEWQDTEGRERQKINLGTKQKANHHICPSAKREREGYPLCWWCAVWLPKSVCSREDGWRSNTLKPQTPYSVEDLQSSSCLVIPRYLGKHLK